MTFFPTPHMATVGIPTRKKTTNKHKSVRAPGQKLDIATHFRFFIFKVHISGSFPIHNLKIYFLSQEHFKLLKKFNSIKKSLHSGIYSLLSP